MINDVTGFRRDPQMIEVLVKNHCLSVWMYSKDPTPCTSPRAQDYEDIIGTISSFSRNVSPPLSNGVVAETK